jgi:hypothetical protein
VDLDRQGHRHFPLGQEFDPLGLLFNEARLFQGLGIHHAVCGKAVKVPEIDDGPGFPEDIGKAALGDAPGQGHLAALKPGFGAASGPGILPFGSPGRGLAPTRARPPAHPFFLMFGPRRRLQF